jgi:hypothetical protein
VANEQSTFGWETLRPHDGGNRLMDAGNCQTVAAKIRTGGAAQGHVFLDLHSEEFGWSILVLDEKLRPVTQAFGQRKSDVWDQVTAELRRRGLYGS